MWNEICWNHLKTVYQRSNLLFSISLLGSLNMLWEYHVRFKKRIKQISNRSFIQPQRVTPDPLKSAYSSPSQACREVLADWSSKITCKQIMPNQGANICQNPCWNLHLREKTKEQCTLRTNSRWPGNILEGKQDFILHIYTVWVYIYKYVCIL